MSFFSRIFSGGNPPPDKNTNAPALDKEEKAPAAAPQEKHQKAEQAPMPEATAAQPQQSFASSSGFNLPGVSPVTTPAEPEQKAAGLPGLFAGVAMKPAG